MHVATDAIVTLKSIIYMKCILSISDMKNRT